MSDIKFGWDPEKKKQRDAERDREATRKQIGNIYFDWQHALTKKPRTRTDLIAAIESLIERLEAYKATEADHGFPVTETIEFIKMHKLAPLQTAAICDYNTAIQHVPASLQARTDGEFEPRREQFRTRAEFDKIEWVQHFSQQPGFEGFYSKVNYGQLDITIFILAKFATDACVVCSLENDVALADFPTLDEEEPA